MSTLKVKKIKICEMRMTIHFMNANIDKTRSLKGLPF